MQKQDLLTQAVEHIDITSFDATPIIQAYDKMAFQARNLARASRIYDQMLADTDCSVVLTLAGSLVSAGLKQSVVDMIRNRMVDVIVSTGANIVDQDFFEALGFRHWQGSPAVDDHQLRELAIDRIYDTYIDEDELRICDDTIHQIANSLENRAYSSREFIAEMGKYLLKNNLGADSIVRVAYEHGVPIFVPAFADCSAGFGLVYHQVKHPDSHLMIDAVRDFRELTQIKIEAGETGLLMLAGGVPKNFVQDTVVAAELLGHEVSMHKYAIQMTVADERDGALSGSTLREACSWGKVDTVYEQMVFGELTLSFPLLASYAYHQRSWEARSAKNWNALFEGVAV
ncbi:MAG: 1,9-bis(guanidino)-5-aza-nonane synthase [Candidatus Sericytochromatia bacterium]